MRHFCFVQFINERCDLALATIAAPSFLILKGQHLGFTRLPLTRSAALTPSLDPVEQVPTHGWFGIIASLINTAFSLAHPNKLRRPEPLLEELLSR